jgi:hypothetical protein
MGTGSTGNRYRVERGGFYIHSTQPPKKIMFKLKNDGRLDLALWLTNQGFGTQYESPIEGYSRACHIITLQCLSKSVMALRITYFSKSDGFRSKEEQKQWGSYTNKHGYVQSIDYMTLHRVSIEYLGISGWVKYIATETLTLTNDVRPIANSKQEALEQKALIEFSDKIKALLVHVITFHGLTLL